MKPIKVLLIFLFFSIQCAYATVYYVSLSGNDATGDGSSARPWRTLQAAASRVTANQGHTIKLLAGTFVENAYIQVPSGVNIEGSGIGVTIIQPGASIHYTAFTWLKDRYLLNLNGAGGNQSIKHLTLNGVSKKLYGGIIVNGRRNVLIESIRVEYFYFTGIWFWDSYDSRVTAVQLKDNAMGNAGGASASILLTNCERMEVDHLHVDEAYGQAFEAVTGKMYDLKLHSNHFSVSPRGNWATPEGQVVPNLAVEFYDADLRGVQVYNNYFDNNLSIVQGNKFITPKGVQTIRVFNNVFDMIARAGGGAHAIELTIHDAEVDHNYIRGGTTGITNWDASPTGFTRHNWKIHHNIFDGLAGGAWPTAVIAMFRHGVNNAHIYNNSVQNTGGSTVHFLEVNNSGVANNVRIENNLIIDANTSYNWGPSKFVSLINGASIKNSAARNNFLQKMPLGSIPGITYSGNLSGDPMIQRSGNKPKPYFELMPGSPLIDKGVNLGFSYTGSGVDIGAYEYGGSDEIPSTNLPRISITAPEDYSSFEAGETITLSATASSPNGTISKVEFFNGSTKLGEDVSSPYSFSWKNATPGSYSITAKTTNSDGISASSSPLTITVTAPIVAVNIPGVIQAENYSAMLGVQLENTTDAGGGQNVGWFGPGDWIDYKVNVTAAGKYTVHYRVSSLITGGTFQLKSGEVILATTTFAATQDWQNWTTIEASVELKGGEQSLRLLNVSGDLNVNWLEFTPTGTTTNTPPVVNITAPATEAVFAEAGNIEIHANATDADGKIIRVEFYNGSTLLGTDTTTPYSFVWKNVSEGDYSITAKATDDAGAVTTSPAVRIHVETVNVSDIPGTIQAEAFTKMSGVNTEATTDEGGGENVGWFEAGDWMDYTVRVATAGTYNVQFRVASLTTGGVLELQNDTGVLATVQVPVTSGWQKWTTVSASINLGAGDQTLRVSAKTGAANLNWVRFDHVPAPSAFEIPGLIEAENYQAMHGIDVEATTDEGGGKNVGWIEAGDWLNYYVDVATSGTYYIEFRVASLTGGGSLEVFTGETKLAAIAVPSTGAWQAWTTVKATARLEAGKQTLKLLAPAGGYNINWIKFTIPDNAAVIPGMLEAESFTAMSGVQTQPTQDTGGGENVGWNDGGDWMDYLVNVTIAGTYTVEFRIASQTYGGSLQLQSGADNLGTIVIPPTGSWQTWTSVVGKVTLAQGIQTIRVLTLTGPVNINWIKFTTIETLAPFEIPGKIQAEDYNDMNGVQAQETTDQDGGQNIGWIETGDWMDYDVFVNSAGSYNVEFRVASLAGKARVSLKKGDNTIAEAAIPSTGGWQQWTTVSALANLTEGKQTIRVYATAGGFNLNWIQFIAPTPIQTAGESRPLRIFSPNNDGINDTWTWTESAEEDCRLSVYNQAGQKIYEAHSSQKTTWDGTSDGKPVTDEAYYYIIDCGNGQTTGAVQILR